MALLPGSAFGWGYDGHRRLAAHMHDVLPASSCLRQWLSGKQNAVNQDMSCDPDRWRLTSNPAYDPQEAPRHYLEIDWVNPIQTYPRDWAMAQQQLGQYAYKNGHVPWRNEELYGQLVDAFKTKNDSVIVPLIFRYSHYVADSFSVLHDTKNFDPNGLHARWESDMLNNPTYIDGITAKAATYYGTMGRADPRNMTFDIVIVGNGLVAQLIAADQAATRPDGGFDMAGFYGAVNDLTARRWGDALTLMASIIASAWVDAGKPMLVGMPSVCPELPQGNVVLKGYPMPGGWTLADGGAGDGGSGGGAGGGGGGGGAGAGGGGGGGGLDETPPGCTCSGVAGAVFLLPILALALLRRARRRGRA